MINLVWLRTFCTLADIGHFTRTAEKLHMTQSGVSQHINKLEAQLKQMLIQREGKQFSLSPAGEKLYFKGRRILDELIDLELSIGDDPAFEGCVQIHSPGSLGLKLYPHLLALQVKNPKLVIDHRFAPNTEIEQAVSSKMADVGLMTVKSQLEEVRSEAIAKEPLLLITPAGFGQPTWQSLCELGFIDHPDGNHHANLLLGANFAEFQHAGLLKKKGFSNQIGMILEPVAMGLGFTILPAHAVAAFTPQSKIKIHHLAQPVFETVYLCTRQYSLRPQRVETIVQEVCRVLQ
ncbi:LysR family transcriptional regulator [Pseudoalteromonas sp. SMS1]|uniref:LysR family transcriptional regulator n=1 Tax=Pseudoalteromonas sp. SMS1 TaxID=2908894 RepID=UPI001F42EA8B|nr:LysR family transcriptional regulator [Pseudoalteromonas sp. SMS1]MCF2857788.1 LysR family transcriptional regulator [Pseudoalteromonas sp. SMS1]